MKLSLEADVDKTFTGADCMDKMSEIIALYHGSVFEFDEIDISKGKPFKDFGRGFYTSRNRQHAETLAIRNKEIEHFRLNKGKQIKPFIYSYHFDLDVLNQLTVKILTEYQKNGCTS